MAMAIRVAVAALSWSEWESARGRLTGSRGVGPVAEGHRGAAWWTCDHSIGDRPTAASTRPARVSPSQARRQLVRVFPTPQT